MTEKRLSIILPSFNDARVVEAIDSIRRFDDLDIVRLVVIDGGSDPAIVELLRAAVRPGDVLISERDRGIFDGLNKGLDQVDCEYVGWLGSDDLYSCQVKASDVVAALDRCDLYVTGLALFDDSEQVLRITKAWPSEHHLARFGLHNPHYATFGRRELLCSRRFDLHLKGADIAYFLDLFATRPRVIADPRIGVLQRQGGFSTSSYGKILTINRELYGVYARHVGPVLAPLSVGMKLGYKLLGRLRRTLSPLAVATLRRD